MTRLTATMLTLPALALPLLGLGGCTTQYAADVRNRTGQVVSVEMLVRNGPDMFSLAAAPVRLGPGDRGAVGPAMVEQNRNVVLRVDTPGNPGYPALLDLRPGATVAEVSDDGGGSRAPIRVREVAR